MNVAPLALNKHQGQICVIRSSANLGACTCLALKRWLNLSLGHRPRNSETVCVWRQRRNFISSLGQRPRNSNQIETRSAEGATHDMTRAFSADVLLVHSSWGVAPG